MYTGISINELIDAVLIGAWAFLFTGPLSEYGQLFGPLKALIYRITKGNEFFFNPLIGCAKCHAGQLALWLPLIFTGCINVRLIVISILTGHLLEKWSNR